jgi:hypothetical protein
MLKRAARRVVVASPSRHRPIVKVLAVDRDGHALGGFVHFNQQVGVGGLAKRERRDGGGGQRCDEAVDAHRRALHSSIHLTTLWQGGSYWT